MKTTSIFKTKRNERIIIIIKYTNHKKIFRSISWSINLTSIVFTKQIKPTLIKNNSDQMIKHDNSY